MNVHLAYLGRSGLTGNTLSLAPNLTREPVSFNAPLTQPLRFREAISALHDVVISDLRFQPRDKTVYQEWKKNENRRLARVRTDVYKEAKAQILENRAKVPKDLEKNYKTSLKRYWSARQKYASYLLKHNYELWRQLMPCDPVITIADDVAFFECFSADESSYGCLTVNRDESFGSSSSIQLGTTNVDYSWDLYNHFQALRSYRETRFRVDPSGFEVATENSDDYREEKIDLPDGWLRGFMQIQQAMSLPMNKVTLSREAVYSLLVWLKRNKAKTSPRALRFELLPGEMPSLVIEPWEKRIDSRGTRYEGGPTEPIRIWGRQRLLVLARLLPLVDRVDVHLLGTGLPSFWVAHMGEMRLTLGLSGWTTNDWTRGSAMDLLLPPAAPTPDLIERTAQFLQSKRRAKFDDVESHTMATPGHVLAALGHLAHTGQVIADLNDNVYRWRQIMPQALGEKELGPESPELSAGKKIIQQRRVKITKQEEVTRGASIVIGSSETQSPEIMIDGDGRIKRGKCGCSYYYKYSFRNGPCRHMIALHRTFHGVGGESETTESADTVGGWYQKMKSRLT